MGRLCWKMLPAGPVTCTFTQKVFLGTSVPGS